MNINKAIYKSEQLVSLYGEQQNEGLLEESKKLNRGIDSKLICQQLNIYIVSVL